jgi:hypothetical protein
MAVLFESILLFSLAVLIIIVGLLVYYFKKRIVEVEQKSSKSLEIVHDLYMQQMKMKGDFNAIIQSLQEEDQEDITHAVLDHELNESDKIKLVNVDMTFPEEVDINDDISDNESIGEVEGEPKDTDELEDEEHIIVNKVDNLSQETQSQSVSRDELKKMTPSTLKSLLISKGVSAELAHKMKKNELIDALMST